MRKQKHTYTRIYIYSFIKKKKKKTPPEKRALSLEEEKGQVLKPPFMSMCARSFSSGRQDQALRRSHLHSAHVACECPILVTTVWNRKQSIHYCENNAGHLEIEVLHTHTHTHTHTHCINQYDHRTRLPHEHQFK